MDEITLRRTGRPPLAFRGEPIAGASSYRPEGPGQARWHEARAYRTAGGAYVLAVGYRSRWQGEDDRDRAETCADPAALIDLLNTVNPLEGVIGYPEGESYRDKQFRLNRDVRARWDRLRSDLYDQLGGAFVERIA